MICKTEKEDKCEVLEKRMSEEEKMKERIVGEKTASVCPGLPSPSGVHLVTHPLRKAQYMTGWQREREKEGERERERGGTQWGIHRPAMTCTQGFPFYSI